MSLPTSQPLPSDESKQLPPARRRRKQRLLIPGEASHRAAFIEELGNRVVPSIDFFLFSLLSGLVIALAIRTNSPAFFLLAALVTPFMAPAIGLSLATVAGSARFFFQALGGLAVGSLLAFLGGLVSGLLTQVWPVEQFSQAVLHTNFSMPDFFVLTVGASLTTFLMIRAPKSRPLAASVALAYELYLPMGVAGFGLAARIPELWPAGLVVFFVHLAWAVLIGALVLVGLGLRPFNLFGYTAGTTLIIACAAGIIIVSGFGTAVIARIGLPALTATPTASPTLTLTPTGTPLPPTATQTPTRTLVPSKTYTVTVSPVPTPVWARIDAEGSDGAVIREEPDQGSPAVRILLNGIMVEVLNEVKQVGNSTWVHVRTTDGQQGWIIRGLLATATPAPGW